MCSISNHIDGYCWYLNRLQFLSITVYQLYPREYIDMIFSIIDMLVDQIDILLILQWGISLILLLYYFYTMVYIYIHIGYNDILYRKHIYIFILFQFYPIICISIGIHTFHLVNLYFWDGDSISHREACWMGYTIYIYI